MTTVTGTVLDTQPILEPTAVCVGCREPYFPVSDDPSPAHPGCAPADEQGWKHQTALFRWGWAPPPTPDPDRDPLVTRPGAMRARHWSVCPRCDEVIPAGRTQVLAAGYRRWVCRRCAPTQPDRRTTP